MGGEAGVGWWWGGGAVVVVVMVVALCCARDGDNSISSKQLLPHDANASLALPGVDGALGSCLDRKRGRLGNLQTASQALRQAFESSRVRKPRTPLAFCRDAPIALAKI